MENLEKIAESCKKLKLSRNIVNNMQEIEAQTHSEFLLELFQREIRHREESRKQRYITSAGFHTIKTFEDYDFQSIKMPHSISIEEIKSCEFINRKENLILYGNVGTGKTHLATAIGIAACQKSYPVAFYRTAALINALIEAKRGGDLQRFLNRLAKKKLLICDEWGYVPYDKQGAQLLFQVISDCYEKCSIILTTNLDFSKWVNVFYDAQMTTAMIDRLVHHSHLLIFEGESYRVKKSKIR